MLQAPVVAELVFPFKETNTVKIASFNINGIKARTNALMTWLREAQPDVALLQEIKSVNENFPSDFFKDLGYNVAVNGQKSFNGVAILSKLPIEDIVTRLPGDSEDDQARWLEVTIVGNQAIRMCNLYLPNGNPAPGPKYDYKLSWMRRLHEKAKELIDSEIPAFMAGDYNIIPQAEDAANIGAWEQDALFLPESRTEFRKILNLGFTDAFRAKHNCSGHYSFWDYQAGAWDRDDGIRIDHFLLTPQCADLLKNCQIDKHIRSREKPSDHVPIWIELDV
jgi:exodeoxyribonuclease-3